MVIKMRFWILSRASCSVSLINNYFDQLILNFFSYSTSETFSLFSTEVGLNDVVKANATVNLEFRGR